MAYADAVDAVSLQIKQGSSPITGFVRDDWTALADRLLNATAQRLDRMTGLVRLPGAPSVHGRQSDGLEGFARTFLLLSFRTHCEADDYSSSVLDRYVSGLNVGTAGGWPDASVRSQSLIEAGSIAIGLHLTRHLIWDQLGMGVRNNIVKWLRGIGDETPRAGNNLVLFPAVINAFLQSVDEPFSANGLYGPLQAAERMYVGDGWYGDGDTRSFDYYNAWAFHFYLPMIARMCNMSRRLDYYKDRLAAFLPQHELFFGGQANPVYYGRSLIYRSATVAAQWMAAWLGVDDQSLGRTRRTASGCIQYFAEHGAFADDLMSMGWHAEQRRVAQYYSGPASPYWAVKGFFGLVMPKTHAVWNEEEQPLPIEESSYVANLKTPGMLLRGSRDDGVVELVPYNASHDYLCHESGYNRVSYSNVTSPVLRRRPLSDANVVITGLGGQRRLWKATGESLADSAVHSSFFAKPYVPGRLPSKVVGSRLTWTQRLELTTIVSGEWLIWLLDLDNREPMISIECGASALAVEDLMLGDERGHDASIVNELGMQSSIVGLYGFQRTVLRSGSGDHAFGDKWAYPALRARQLHGSSVYVWATRLAGKSEADAPSLELKNGRPYAIWHESARLFRI